MHPEGLVYSETHQLFLPCKHQRLGSRLASPFEVSHFSSSLQWLGFKFQGFPFSFLCQKLHTCNPAEMKPPRCRWPSEGTLRGSLVRRGPPAVPIVPHGRPGLGAAASVERRQQPRRSSIFRCTGSELRLSRHFSFAGAAASNTSSSVIPGLLQLPGVHTPDQLLQLARECLRDCQSLLGAEEKREQTDTTEEEAKRSVQALDAVSNALCKVADAAELIR